MNSLTPLELTDKILRKATDTLTLSELRTIKTQRIIDDLLDFVYGKNNKGQSHDRNRPSTVGLSANQVGILKQISIVDLGIGHKRYNDLHVLINPVIFWKSKSIINRTESCVNTPNIWGIVERAARVKVRAYDRSGNNLQLDVHGWPAILLQHEIDHLQGNLFIDRLSNPKRAHHVQNDELTDYKKSPENWEAFIDVSKLVTQIKHDH